MKTYVETNQVRVQKGDGHGHHKRAHMKVGWSLDMLDLILVCALNLPRGRSWQDFGTSCLSSQSQVYGMTQVKVFELRVVRLPKRPLGKYHGFAPSNRLLDFLSRKS